MQGPALRTKSIGTRLALAFSFLITLITVLVVALPPTSSANPAGSQSEITGKQPRPAFVPGEVLVRYRSDRAASRQTRTALLTAGGRRLSISIERFDGSNIVPGLRIARVAADDTLAAIET